MKFLILLSALVPTYAFPTPVLGPPLEIDASSLPTRWKFVDSEALALLGKPKLSLLFDETINNIPIADVGVRNFTLRKDVPREALKWVRALVGYKDTANEEDWPGAKQARVVEQDGQRILRARLYVRSAGSLEPRKTHVVDIWVTTRNGQGLFLSYDRTVNTHRFGKDAVDDLFSRVRLKPVRAPASREKPL